MSICIQVRWLAACMPPGNASELVCRVLYTGWTTTELLQYYNTAERSNYLS